MSDKKLVLKESMDRTYLIQRLNKPIGVPNPFSFGGGGLPNGGLSKEGLANVSAIFSFDYMGAAEFEWGAVPNALQFIAEQADKRMSWTPMELCMTSGTHSGVYYICPKPYEAGVKKVIDNLLADESSMNLKEHCGLEVAMNPRINRERYPNRTFGWLELNNGFFFFSDEEMYENTKRLFGVK